MASATSPGVHSAVEFEGLDDVAQNEIELHIYRGGHGRLGQPRYAHSGLAGRPDTKLGESVARLQSNLASRLGSDPLVAIYNSPSKEKSTDRRFFCEACTIGVPAREQDWQMHSAGLTHQCQILSLCERGELGHMPAGESKALANTSRCYTHKEAMATIGGLLLQVVPASNLTWYSPSSSCSTLGARILAGYLPYKWKQ